MIVIMSDEEVKALQDLGVELYKTCENTYVTKAYLRGVNPNAYGAGDIETDEAKEADQNADLFNMHSRISALEKKVFEDRKNFEVRVQTVEDLVNAFDSVLERNDTRIDGIEEMTNNNTRTIANLKEMIDEDRDAAKDVMNAVEYLQKKVQSLDIKIDLFKELLTAVNKSISLDTENKKLKIVNNPNIAKALDSADKIKKEQQEVY